jgi:sigma-E factor negative regulatory protein RseA
MSEKLHEQISALVDNEINDPELLIRQICRDTELQERWRRHHVVHDVLSNQLSTTPVDLSHRISQALESEPEHHSNNALAKISKPPSRTRYVMKQVAGLAIAATVSAVAVISVQQNSNPSSIPAQDVAVLNSNTTVAQAQVRFVNESQKLDDKVQSKLSNYLVNHNEYSITSNMQGVLPYTRVVAITSQHVVVRNIDEK